MSEAETEASSPAAVRRRSEKRKSYANLTIRLLPEEREKIEAEAERLGKSLGGYVRDRVVPKSAIRSVRRALADEAKLAELLGQVGKVGGNIHQLVKRVNFNEPVERAEIDAAIADWRAIARQIMDTLGRGPGHADSD